MKAQTKEAATQMTIAELIVKLRKQRFGRISVRNVPSGASHNTARDFSLMTDAAMKRMGKVALVAALIGDDDDQPAAPVSETTPTKPATTAKGLAGGQHGNLVFPETKSYRAETTATKPASAFNTPPKSRSTWRAATEWDDLKRMTVPSLIAELSKALATKGGPATNLSTMSETALKRDGKAKIIQRILNTRKQIAEDVDAAATKPIGETIENAKALLEKMDDKMLEQKSESKTFSYTEGQDEEEEHFAPALDRSSIIPTTLKEAAQMPKATPEVTKPKALRATYGRHASGLKADLDWKPILDRLATDEVFGGVQPNKGIYLTKGCGKGFHWVIAAQGDGFRLEFCGMDRPKMDRIANAVPEYEYVAKDNVKKSKLVKVVSADTEVLLSAWRNFNHCIEPKMIAETITK